LVGINVSQKKLLDRKLLLRLTIPSVIAAVILVGVIIDAFITAIPVITFAWILVGIIIGYPFGRLTKISWNSDRGQFLGRITGGNPRRLSGNQNYYKPNHPHGIWLFDLCDRYRAAHHSGIYFWKDTWDPETNSNGTDLTFH
jgi:hypothetical protein